VLRLPALPSYRRLGLALAIATVAMLAAAGSALAAPSALPDNPLYPIKQLEESVRIAFTPQNGRLTYQLELANERLREAQVMAGNHKPLLAGYSLRAFRVVVDDAAAALKNPADPKAAQAALKMLHVKLEGVERENASRGDDDRRVKQLVADARSELDRIEQLEVVRVPPAVVIGEQVTPQPTAQPTPRPTLRPTPRPTPRPKPSDREHVD
jgi:hypothetical protein